MADKVPIRAGLDGSSVTGLAIFASGETIGIAHGGTGLATVGSNQLVTGNGTSAMTSESNLTFDGSTLKSTGAVCATGNLVVGGNTSLDGGTFTFNDSGADVDFRIEGDSEANLFVADASVDRIGIGTATPSHLVDIEGVAHAATCFVSADVCATTKVVTPALCVGSQYALPAADGSAGEILCTDGSGAITFAEAASSGHTIAEEGSVLASRTCLNFVGAAVTAADNSGTNATDVTVCATNALLGFRVAAGTACTITLSNAAIGECLQSDTSPKLGGNLDVNSNSIISASNGNIPITPNGSGIVILDGICHPTADGSAGQVLCTNGSAALQWATIASTSPGGSDTHVQFNDGGSFGGASGLTWDDTTFKASNICTAGTATIATVTATSIGGTLTTAAQTAITSVGTLGSLVVSGALTVDTNTFKVDNHNNRVGIGTATPNTVLEVTGDTSISNGYGLIVGHTAMLSIGNVGELQVLGTAAGDSSTTTARFSADTGGPSHDFLKSRNATIGSSTIVQDDDELGGLIWYADDGNDFYSSSARIFAAVDGTPGENDVPGRLIFATTADGANSPTERMRITSDGRIDIGTTGATVSSSADKLVINDGANAGMTIYSTGTSSGQMKLSLTNAEGADAGAAIIYNNANDDLLFNVNGPTERIRFLGTGGIAFGGDTADANALDDYEEGTWTACICAGSGSISLCTAYNTGSYTKIGRLVTLTGAFTVSSVSSPGGAALIYGMPFSTGGGSDQYEYRSAGSISPWAQTGTINSWATFVPANSNTIYIQDNGVNSEADHFQAGTEIRMEFTYIV